ncbi:MAG: fatty acid desaturase, partial [Aestuariivirgaceae bacterium]
MSFVATNAASSGVKLDRKVIKQLGKRSDRPGLVWLAQWLAMLAATGYLLHLSLGTWWVIPTMTVYGAVLTVPAYSLSHETSHGTAFRTRWLNELVLYLSSLIYLEEPYHRRYAHTSHHTYTYHVGKDGQIPFALPMSFGDWLRDISNASYYGYYARLFIKHAFGRFSPMTRQYTPEGELPKLKWGARFCLAVYGGLALLIAAGHWWPVTFILVPRLVGGPIMLLFTLLQHVELEEDQASILRSTRSFKTN